MRCLVVCVVLLSLANVSLASDFTARGDGVPVEWHWFEVRPGVGSSGAGSVAWESMGPGPMEPGGVGVAELRTRNGSPVLEFGTWFVGLLTGLVVGALMYAIFVRRSARPRVRAGVARGQAISFRPGRIIDDGRTLALVGFLLALCVVPGYTWGWNDDVGDDTATSYDLWDAASQTWDTVSQGDPIYWRDEGSVGLGDSMASYYEAFGWEVEEGEGGSYVCLVGYADYEIGFYRIEKQIWITTGMYADTWESYGSHPSAGDLIGMFIRLDRIWNESGQMKMLVTFYGELGSLDSGALFASKFYIEDELVHIGGKNCDEETRTVLSRKVFDFTAPPGGGTSVVDMDMHGWSQNYRTNCSGLTWLGGEVQEGYVSYTVSIRREYIGDNPIPGIIYGPDPEPGPDAPFIDWDDWDPEEETEEEFRERWWGWLGELIIPSSESVNHVKDTASAMVDEGPVGFVNAIGDGLRSRIGNYSGVEWLLGDFNFGPFSIPNPLKSDTAMVTGINLPPSATGGDYVWDTSTYGEWQVIIRGWFGSFVYAFAGIGLIGWLIGKWSNR